MQHTVSDDESLAALARDHSNAAAGGRNESRKHEGRKARS